LTYHQGAERCIVASAHKEVDPAWCKPNEVDASDHLEVTMAHTTPTPPITPRIVTPEFIEQLHDAALARAFGFGGPGRGKLQEAVRHGYLLALEEVMKG
jgi:hypothetical protein